MTRAESDAGLAKGRVLFAPLEIAGYAARMQSGLERLGWSVDVVELNKHGFGYGAKAPDSRGLTTVQRLLSRGANRSAPVRLALAMATLPWRFWFSIVHMSDYDVVVYMFGRTLFFGLDRWLARKRGVRIVSVFLGSDARPPFMDGPVMTCEEPPSTARLARLNRSRSQLVRRVEAASDAVIAQPASAQYLRKAFVNWFAVGMPPPEAAAHQDGDTARRLEAQPETQSERPLRVVHAPSNPMGKGTSHIVATLRSHGRRVDLRLLTGRSNSEVLRELREADLVVDQLYSDLPLPGLAIESAQCGTPVITFGYAAEFLKPYATPFGMPFEQFQPTDSMPAIIDRALNDPEWLQEIASVTWAYVNGTGSLPEVARRFERVLLDDFPQDWLTDPASIDYIVGSGVTPDQLVGAVRALVGAKGPRSLGLPGGGSALAAALRLISTAPEGEERPPEKEHERGQDAD